MELWTRLSALLIVAVATCISKVTTASESDLISENLYLDNQKNGFENPDPVLWNAIQEVLQDYSKGTTISEWKLSSDKTKGLLWTNYFRTHKGEVRLKIEAVVWGKEFRVEVWHNTGTIFKWPRKTEWARRVERALQVQVHEQFGRPFQKENSKK